MTQQDRAALFHRALGGVRRLRATDPDSRILVSIENQLLYLADVATGARPPDRLREIVLGVQTAREIDGWDDDLAALLYACATEADAMQREETLAGAKIEPLQRAVAHR